MPEAGSSTRAWLVLDTNVVLDLFHFGDPAFISLRRALEAGVIGCRACTATLGEWRRVLAYPEFALASDRQAALYDAYAALVERVDPRGVQAALPRCRDPDDQKFLVLAAASGADFLVSKDRALLKLRRGCARRFQIVHPTEAVAWLEATA